MEESGAILVLGVFFGLKRAIEEAFGFLSNSIVYWRRMARSIFVIKNRIIKAILF